MKTEQFEAVYENGALRPLRPVLLKEQQRVVVTMTLDSEAEHPFWEAASAQQRGMAWSEWVETYSSSAAPALPDEALRRENMYD